MPFSFGDNVVRRTSCQHFQQHLYHQVLPAVFIGHTNHEPCCTHFQPRQDGTTEPQRSQRVVGDDIALVGWGVGCSWGQNGYGGGRGEGRGEGRGGRAWRAEKQRVSLIVAARSSVSIVQLRWCARPRPSARAADPARGPRQGPPIVAWGGWLAASSHAAAGWWSLRSSACCCTAVAWSRCSFLQIEYHKH